MKANQGKMDAMIDANQEDIKARMDVHQEWMEVNMNSARNKMEARREATDACPERTKFTMENSQEPVEAEIKTCQV
jgi:hypothetical protein